MKLDLEAKKLVDKYKKRIEKKLEKNPGTIVYHQGRLDGYIEGLLDGMEASFKSISEELVAVRVLEKKLKESK
ncbi:unnamed protein product [marine sediment metagenome]|uniref:Uncharacterized protein n=1 Tax=marine sediment metagenome TaxID=412755 RepID=X1IN85_9ZZZZ